MSSIVYFILLAIPYTIRIPMRMTDFRPRPPPVFSRLSCLGCILAPSTIMVGSALAFCQNLHVKIKVGNFNSHSTKVK